MTACWSLLVSLDLPSTTRVAVVSLTGWKGAASCSASSDGALDGRKELLSVLTALVRLGMSAMHRPAATSQPAMTA